MITSAVLTDTHTKINVFLKKLWNRSQRTHVNFTLCV